MNSSTTPDDGVVQIAIASLRRDGGTQPRAMLDRPTISEYAFELRGGANFPPVVVFYDGVDYWLADGFHRVEAAESISMTQIAAIVRQGTIRDAVLYSVGANATHGLRRSNEDKRRAVTTLLEDEEWSQWSDREIARQSKVHHNTVAKIRASLTGDLSSEPRTYVTKYGTIAQMNTMNIGKVKKEERDELGDAIALGSVAKLNTNNEQASEALNRNQTNEPLSEGDRVMVKESNSLLAGQKGMVTALPNPGSAIVELEEGRRELIDRKDLEKSFSPTPVQKSPPSQACRRSGFNYQPNGCSEYYVRVSETMWKRLEEYQHTVGAATMEGAIERLLPTTAIASHLGL